MPIDRGEWRSIQILIEKYVNKRGEYFVTGKVIKRDEKKKLVWLKEFGDQPIPLVAFDYEVKYYDDSSVGQHVTVNIDVPEVPFTGSVNANIPSKNKQKFAKVEVLVPRVGELVLVAKELGTSRIPRCLGVIKGRGWIIPEE